MLTRIILPILILDLKAKLRGFLMEHKESCLCYKHHQNQIVKVKSLDIHIT